MNSCDDMYMKTIRSTELFVLVKTSVEERWRSVERSGYLWRSSMEQAHTQPTQRSQSYMYKCLLKMFLSVHSTCWVGGTLWPLTCYLCCRWRLWRTTRGAVWRETGWKVDTATCAQPRSWAAGRWRRWTPRRGERSCRPSLTDELSRLGRCLKHFWLIFNIFYTLCCISWNTNVCTYF